MWIKLWFIFVKLTIFIQKQENERVNDGDEHSGPQRDPEVIIININQLLHLLLYLIHYHQQPWG